MPAIPEKSHTPKGRLSRGRIVSSAEALFAAHGFHGTSMRDVAAAAGAPLASVVYHFARKEDLYAAVLGDIGAQLMGELGAARELEVTARALVRWSLKNPGRVRLVLRELLDNPARVGRARALPLAPVLTALTAALERRGQPLAELAVLHAIGAISYVVAARPTLRRIVGKDRDRALMAGYEELATRFVLEAFGDKRGE